MAPSELVAMYRHRKEVQRGLITSHREASGHFVTFLDNHDMRERFYFRDPAQAHRFDDQVTLGLGCLFALLGIPCLYYGTEQGLHGRGGRDLAVREALWGKANAFDRNHPFHSFLRKLSSVRKSEPALRYGRQYFRSISGNGMQFGVSPFPAGVLAFFRILSDQEVLIVANTNTQRDFQGEVIVDASLNAQGTPYRVSLSNKNNARQPGNVMPKAGGSVEIQEPEGGVTHGPVHVVRVDVQPMEVQFLRKA